MRQIIAWALRLESKVVSDAIFDLTEITENRAALEARKLAEYDVEAKLERDNFIARMQIDAIEAERKLACKKHRLVVIEQHLKELAE